MVDVVDIVSVCVEVKTAVEASALDERELVEDDDGDVVTVGLMTMVAVDWTSQPAATQLYPGIQHPPPGLSGQLV